LVLLRGGPRRSKRYRAPENVLLLEQMRSKPTVPSPRGYRWRYCSVVVIEACPKCAFDLVDMNTCCHSGAFQGQLPQT
jgi:hypothetical protein